MKKFLSLLCLTVCLVVIPANNSFADTLKNFYAYEIQNTNIREFGAEVKNSIESYKGEDNYKPVKDVKNAYIYTGPDKMTYFIRIYPANNNTHVFVVSNTKYDVHNNDLTVFLKQLDLKYYQLNNKSAFEEYKFDFYDLARKQKLGEFYISPDLVKPLKTGMSKLNNKLAKGNKKTSVIPYSVDNNPIDLECIDTVGAMDNNSKIAFLKKEYRLKQKENKYMHAFEYVLANTGDTPVTITATSERLAGMKDVTTETFIDLDRLDLLDTFGSFPVTLVCTCGLSILCSVPNWVRMAKVVKESTRFTHALPENYKLKAKGRMRILVLKYKNNQKPLNFVIKSDANTYNVSF